MIKPETILYSGDKVRVDENFDSLTIKLNKDDVFELTRPNMTIVLTGTERINVKLISGEPVSCIGHEYQIEEDEVMQHCSIIAREVNELSKATKLTEAKPKIKRYNTHDFKNALAEIDL